MSFIKFCKHEMFEERVELGTTVRLLHCDLGVMGSKRGNSLTLPYPSVAGASCTGLPFFFRKCLKKKKLSGGRGLRVND